MQHDWTHFIKKVYVKATKEDLFSMWLDKDKITKFWLADAKYYSAEDNSLLDCAPQSGDKYEWTFASQAKMTGEILEVEENKVFKFTFGKTYQDSDENVVVTILFHEDENEAWLELLQENIGTDEFGKVHYYVSCQLGWQKALLNLKSIMENDFDLREIDKDRVIEVGGISVPKEDTSFS